MHYSACPPCPLALGPSLNKMATPLWPGFAYKPHQESAIEWMIQREKDEHAGGLLCDEMGLGKTMEVLGTMKNTKAHSQTLLLCPKAVISQWREAATKSAFNVYEVVEDVWKATSPFRNGQPFLFITNYEKLGKPLFKNSFYRIILDEAHRVKNKNGESWKKINEIKRKINK